jgi:hypothetical protein
LGNSKNATILQPHLQKGLGSRIHSSRSGVFINRQSDNLE